MMLGEKYNLVGKAITPLHISSGQVYTSLEYFIENGKVCIIDVFKAFESLNDIEKINSLSELVKGNIKNNRIEMDPRDLFGKVGVDVKNFSSTFLLSELPPGTRAEIKRFIGFGNSHYIPGSSIKGAIRTAILFDYYSKNIDRLSDLIDEFSNKGSGDIDGKRGKNKEESKRLWDAIAEDFLRGLLGKSKEDKVSVDEDPFKYLHVTDSEVFGKEKLVVLETQRYNSHFDKKLNRVKGFGNKTNIEAFGFGGSFSFSIFIDEGFKRSFKVTGDCFDYIKTCCRNFSETICDFETSCKNNHKDLKDFYSRFKNEIAKGTYINLGFGGGMISKTIYLLMWKKQKSFNLVKPHIWLRKDRNIERETSSYLDYPRTRVIYKSGEGYRPLGWVKIETSK